MTLSHRRLPPLVLVLAGSLLCALTATATATAAVIAAPSVRQAARATLVVTTRAELVDELNSRRLKLSDRQAAVDIAKDIFKNITPNLAIYKTVAGVDPNARLTGVVKSAGRASPPLRFHEEMAKVFRSANDLHSTYTFPAPFDQSAAVLGFFLSVYFDKARKPHFVISSFIDRLDLDKLTGLERGSELLKYNGQSVAKVVKKLGKASYGSNDDAQFSLGVGLLVVRTLIVDELPPLGNVTLTFKNDGDSKSRSISVAWTYVRQQNQPESRTAQVITLNENDMPMKMMKRALMSEIRLSVLFRGRRTSVRAAAATPTRLPRLSRAAVAQRTMIDVKPAFMELFEAFKVKTSSNGEIGVLKVKSFNSMSTKELRDEVKRLLQKMPPRGLVVDIRGNPGGSGTFAEDVAWMATGGGRSARGTAFRATKKMEDLWEVLLAEAKRDAEKIGLMKSVAQSSLAAVKSGRMSGETMSGAAQAIFEASSLGKGDQVYKGPVVTLVDADTFSAGDYFTALMVDEGLSCVIGTADRTGGGGASTATLDDLSMLASGVFKKLPEGVAFSTAFARYFRSGSNQGALVESFGVEVNRRYHMTKADLMNDECDLFDELGKQLKVRKATGKCA